MHTIAHRHANLQSITEIDVNDRKYNKILRKSKFLKRAEKLSCILRNLNKDQNELSFQALS